MKKIRLFIVSSSLLLAAWLSASYFSEVRISQDQTEAAAPSRQTEENVAQNTQEEEVKTPLPVAHFE